MSGERTYEVTIDGRSSRVTVRPNEGGWAVRVGEGPERTFHAGHLGATEWQLREGGRSHRVGLHLERDRFSAQVRGHAIHGELIDPRRKAFDAGGSASKGEIRTPMPGAIVRVPVSVGQEVAAGQVLVVVEAMKMENEFKAPMAGKVAAVHVRAGQAVEAHTVLVSLEEGA
jgi:biotin carboxyl carrier protein